MRRLILSLALACLGCPAPAPAQAPALSLEIEGARPEKPSPAPESFLKDVSESIRELAAALKGAQTIHVEVAIHPDGYTVLAVVAVAGAAVLILVLPIRKRGA